MKPKVFVGSSVKNLDIAYAIQANLQHRADVTVWDQGVFPPTTYPLDDLLKELDESDFGVFVFAPEDIVQIKDQHFSTVRDNVLFEFGLFVGRLGKERTFFVLPQNLQDFHLLTDLSGVIPATYDSTRNALQVALGPACFQIQQAIQRLSIRKNRLEKDPFGQGKTSEFWEILFGDCKPDEKIYMVFSPKDKGYDFVNLKPDLDQVGHTVKVSCNEVFPYINHLQKELLPILNKIKVIHGGVNQEPPKYNPRGKLIIIGSSHANEICNGILKKLRPNIPYRFKVNENNYPRYKYISAGRKSYPDSYEESEILDRLDKDYGIVLRIKNPNEGSGNNKILVLGGNHGHGTQAAIEALSDHELLNSIHQAVGENDFEALFKSDTSGTQPTTFHLCRISVLKNGRWREIDVKKL